MATEHILTLLIQERDRLNRAIEALQGPAKRRGRPPKSVDGSDAMIVRDTLAKGKKRSAATRKKMAMAQKKRWAEKKAAE
jgi:hypothetical protein